jgi:hypothetical protein
MGIACTFGSFTFFFSKTKFRDSYKTWPSTIGKITHLFYLISYSIFFFIHLYFIFILLFSLKSLAIFTRSQAEKLAYTPFLFHVYDIVVVCSRPENVQASQSKERCRFARIFTSTENAGRGLPERGRRTSVLLGDLLLGIFAVLNGPRRAMVMARGVVREGENMEATAAAGEHVFFFLSLSLSLSLGRRV